MKEIEERAVIHANKFDKEIGAHHYSYCIGATEQKAIDDAEHTEEMRKLNEEWKENLEIQRKMLIERAYEWFQYNAWSFGNYAQGDSSYEWEMAFECFRKAMEE